MTAGTFACSAMLRMVPLSRYAGEDLAAPLLILPRLRGRGTAEGGGGAGFLPSERTDHENH
jgi:hypothetical protein